MNNKKIIIVLATVVVVMATAGIIIWRQSKAPTGGDKQTGAASAPEFMTEAEKQQFQLSPQSRVQVISRDGEGAVTVYKIINADQDIVPDPSRLEPVSPRRGEAPSLPAADSGQ